MERDNAGDLLAFLKVAIESDLDTAAIGVT